MVFDLDSIKLYSDWDGNFTADVTVQNFVEESTYNKEVTPETPRRALVP